MSDHGVFQQKYLCNTVNVDETPTNYILYIVEKYIKRVINVGVMSEKH